MLVDVDPGKVERVIENLLMNAARHTPQGTPVHVRVHGRTNGVVLEVEDEGPGVPDELKETLFEPFKQGDTPGGRGVGIGLSLVKRFAELHGGTAYVEDAPGGGARFVVTLPGDVSVPEREDAGRGRAEAPRGVVSDSAPPRGRKVGMSSSLDERLLRGDVPEILRGILLDRPWDLRKLLALELPLDEASVEGLAWQLDLPWWRVGDDWFVVTPNQVRAAPARHRDQWDRTMRTDLDVPIHIRETDRGPVILDGVHRLLKASIEGRPSLPACMVRAADLPLIYA